MTNFWPCKIMSLSLSYEVLEVCKGTAFPCWSAFWVGCWSRFHRWLGRGFYYRCCRHRKWRVCMAWFKFRFGCWAAASCSDVAMITWIFGSCCAIFDGMRVVPIHRFNWPLFHLVRLCCGFRIYVNAWSGSRCEWSDLFRFFASAYLMERCTVSCTDRRMCWRWEGVHSLNGFQCSNNHHSESV